MSIRIDIGVCRVCCKPDAPHSILKHARKFNYCTTLEVAEDDGLPSRICDVCLERLHTAAEFKRKSLSSDRQLRSFIEKVNSQFHVALGGSDDEREVVEEEEEEVVVSPPSPPPMCSIPLNSALSCGSAEGALSSEQKAVVAVDIKVQRGDVEPKREEEREKFRAVAVIQEKPVIKPENEMIEVELEYDVGMLQQDEEVVMEQGDEGEREPEMGEGGSDTTEEPEMIYITLPHGYRQEDENEQEQEESTEEDRFVEHVDIVETLSDGVESTVTAVDHQPDTPGAVTILSESSRIQCPQCPKTFSSRTNLNRHQLSHSGSKPYICVICEKGFTQSGSLKQHMLIHQNLRPYVCTVCDRGFTQPKSLKFHMRRHTNEKPFVCPHCEFPFRQRDGLKRHILVKHTSVEEKPVFVCLECGRRFQTRYALSCHRKRHAGDQEEEEHQQDHEGAEEKERGEVE